MYVTFNLNLALLSELAPLRRGIDECPLASRLHAPLDVGRNVEAIEKAQRRRGGGGGGAADDGHGDGGHRHRGKAVQADPRLKAPSIKLSL